MLARPFGTPRSIELRCARCQFARWRFHWSRAIAALIVNVISWSPAAVSSPSAAQTRRAPARSKASHTSAVPRPFSRLRRSCQATMIPAASPRSQASTASPSARSRQGFEPDTPCSTTSGASVTPFASAQRAMSRRCSSIEMVRSFARDWRRYGTSGRPLLSTTPPVLSSRRTFGVGDERELADDQRGARRVQHAPVELAILVLEDPQPPHLAREPHGLPLTVRPRDGGEHAQADSDLAPRVAVHHHARPRDALDNGPHSGSRSLTREPYSSLSGRSERASL